jgi:hypothetical protein
MVNKSKSVWAGWLDISAGIIWLLGDAFLFLIILGFSVGLGGVLTLKRTNWVLAIIGSIRAVPLGLGIIATVLIIQSRNVFN